MSKSLRETHYMELIGATQPTNRTMFEPASPVVTSQHVAVGNRKVTGAEWLVPTKPSLLAYILEVVHLKLQF